MYRVFLVILTLVAVINRHASQTTTNQTVCTCSESRLCCIIEGPDDIVNVKNDYCDGQVSKLRLFIPWNTKLPSRMIVGDTTRLSHIQIIGDYLKDMSEEVFFGQEDALNYVDIQDGELVEIPSAALRHLHRLNYLNLSRNSIGTIDCSLQNLNLTELILENNDISTIYTCAFPSSLLKLRLDNNSLESLNDSLKGHDVLDSLYISGNKFSSLEGELEGLDRLSFIHATKNKIKIIGTAPVILLGLKFLYLSHNRIIELGNSLNGFINLETLDLSHNYLDKLTTNSFANLTKLTELTLFNNRIFNMDDRTFESLGKLENLVISKNRIDSLDGKLEGLNSLKKLYANHNRIKVIGNAFMNLSSLKELTLHENMIMDLRNSLRALSQLETLDLTKNAIKYISENNFYGLKNLRLLNISKNVFERPVTGTVFAGLTNLTILNLSWTSLKLQHLVVPGFMGINSTSSQTVVANDSIQDESYTRSTKLTKTLWMKGNDVDCSDSLISVLKQNGIELIAC